MRQLVVMTILTALCGITSAFNGDMGVATDPNTNGSAAYPWLIEDLDDFDEFAGNSAYWAAGVHTKLMTNIDLSGRTYTTAVIAPHHNFTDSFTNVRFAGTFDGNSYSVTNVTIELLDPFSYEYYKGLFGYIENATILNLTIEKITIDGFSFIGGLAGYSLSSNIVNCSCSGQIKGYDDFGGLIGFLSNGSVTGCHSNTIVTGEYRAGGLIGQFSGGTIANCYATGDVSVNLNNAGGLIGDSSSPSGYVDSCYATGNVTSADYSAGGFIGRNYGGQITNSYATGNVTSVYRSGGFAATNTGIIINCYSMGDVSGSSSVGGVVGSNGSSASILKCYSNGDVSSHSDVGNGSAGGIVGSTGGAGLISHCYATGIISSSDYAGGIMGIEHNYANYESCFWDITRNPTLQDSGSRGDVPEIFAESTAGMKLQSTFTNWDFVNDWMMLRPGEDYPRLAWQAVFAGDIAGLYGVDMVDVAYLARYWGLTGCDSGTDCGRADIDASGDVGLADLAAVAEDWLK